MTLPDFLSRESLGYIRLSGHRIGLNHIVELYNDGYSPEMLQEQFPTLSLELIHKVIAFYLENRVTVDALVAAEREVCEQQHATAGKQGPSLEELRRRLRKVRAS
jgi:uncharacterized protein (DUF433 family)